jgi:hypothetical protein
MAAYEKKPSIINDDDLDHQPRKSSIASIAGGFQAANILQNVKVDPGSTPHGDSTTFASAGLDAYYKPQPHWEGLHRYDPDFTWEPAEERKLVRKVRCGIPECFWMSG